MGDQTWETTKSNKCCINYQFNRVLVHKNNLKKDIWKDKSSEKATNMPEKSVRYMETKRARAGQQGDSLTLEKSANRN